MTHHTATAKRSRSRFRIFGEVISELKKVVWLSRREAFYLAFIVLLVAIVIGLILGAFDFGFSRLVDKLFIGR